MISKNEYMVLKSISNLVDSGTLVKNDKSIEVFALLTITQVTEDTKLEEFRVRSIVAKLIKAQYVDFNYENILTANGIAALADYPQELKEAQLNSRAKSFKEFGFLAFSAFIGALAAGLIVDYLIPWITGLK